ncbi:MAG: class I SAM-dependent methyltransferase [Planctomycetes bacterium]|nr:class I SAM-dependent methyltransferase [Planctomycetota bacterium]
MIPERRKEAAVPPSIDRMVRCDRIADTYDQTFADYKLLQYDHQVLLKWFEKPGRLLDLGCGTGRTLVEFAKRGFEVTGVDLSPRMLQISRAKLQAAGISDAQLLEGNLADLPLDKLQPPYDYAVCLGATLGYVQGHANRVRAVAQAGSLLAPGGQYAFHVQNLLYNLPTLHIPFILTGLLKAAVGRGEFGDQIFWRYRGLRWVYMHAFTPRELARLVREAGLELIEIHHLNKPCGGPLEGGCCRAWRSHGFIVRCRRP